MPLVFYTGQGNKRRIHTIPLYKYCSFYGNVGLLAINFREINETFTQDNVNLFYSICCVKHFEDGNKLDLNRLLVVEFL